MSEVLDRRGLPLQLSPLPSQIVAVAFPAFLGGGSVPCAAVSADLVIEPPLLSQLEKRCIPYRHATLKAKTGKYSDYLSRLVESAIPGPSGHQATWGRMYL